MRRRLILLALAALIPLIAVSALLAGFYLTEQRDAIRRDAIRRAADYMDRVDQDLSTQLQLLQVLAQSPILDDASPDLARFHLLAARFPQNLRNWHTVILVSPDGQQLLNSHVPFGTKLPPLNDPDGHRRLMETGKPVVGDVTEPGPLSTDQLAKAGLRVPVIRDGRIVFDLVAVISTAHLSELLAPESLPRSFRVGLIDAAGRIAASPQLPDRVGQMAGATALAERGASTAGVYTAEGVDREPMVVAFQRSDATGWSVHVGVPASVFNAPLVRAEWMVGLALAAALGLTALLVVLVRREWWLERQEAEYHQRALRMEALGRMTGGVAHDFNNVLMVMLSGIELIQRKALDRGIERYLVELRKAAERAAHLTRELTAFSRGVPTRTGITDLNQRVRDVLSMVRQSLGVDVRVELSLTEEPLPVDIDAIQFDLAILNLAVNARDAMPAGGTITIATGRSEFPDRSGRFGAVVSVADTGSGVPREALPHVFEPFFTTKPVGKGTGLGLSQVYTFAKMAGGLADIESGAGRGTVVSIHLPLSQATTLEEEPGGSTALVSGKAEGEPTVLVVEDNAEIRRAAVAHLAEAGYAVAAAIDADEALRTIERHPVHHLVSDLRMPGTIDGYALATIVRERWPETSIVLMSGYSDSAEAAAKQGFEVLQKPFALPRLVEALRSDTRRRAG